MTVTGHFKTSQPGSNQNRPLRESLIYIRFLDSGDGLFNFFMAYQVLIACGSP